MKTLPPNRRHAAALAALPLLALAALGTQAAGGRAPATVSADMAVTLAGAKSTPLTLAAVSGAKATVLLFVGTECPISNGYAPEIAALAKAYRAHGAQVVLVYSNAGTTAAAVAQHQKAYGLSSLPALLDTDQRIADAVGAVCTPEAFVLDAGRSIRYHGRIDNGSAARGIARGSGATTHDLRAALDAVLAGRTVAVAAAPAVGCSIERASNVASKTGPTYARDVAPILDASCVTCHRAGEIGPMPLSTYADAKRWAENIASVTSTKRMPPWKPTAECGPFAGERRLSAAQIATLEDWAKAGAPLGNPKDEPLPPKFVKGWQLGEPDLILTMPAAWKVPASGPDVYRCFTLPTNLTTDREVVAVQYRAGNKSVVHHCLGFVDTAGQGRARDGKDGQPGYTSFGGPGFTPSGEVGGWAPGNMPRFLPDGIARPLPAGSDIVLQVHYHPDGKPEEDRTSIGLYFAKKPITQTLRTLPIIARVRIPAGDADYETSQTFPVPIDARVISVTPHMHLLGRKISLTLTFPDGTIKPLIRIDDWDFNWQDTYTFREPLFVPKGSKLTLAATYDNSEANPRNPNNPPKPIHWGEATTDEMCIGFVSFVPADANDPLVKMTDGMRARRAARSAAAKPAATGAGL